MAAAPSQRDSGIFFFFFFFFVFFFLSPKGAFESSSRETLA